MKILSEVTGIHFVLTKVGVDPREHQLEKKEKRKRKRTLRFNKRKKKKEKSK